MKKIVIDARELRTSTGRYIERLVHYLQQIDNDHEYLVLLKPKDFADWHPTNPNFKKVACPHKEFSFDEQIGLLKQLNELKPDLVHFGMVQQPLLYRGRTVTTMHDLTTIRFRNPSKNPIVFTIKQLVYKGVNWYVPRKSTRIVVPSKFVKRDVMRFAHVGSKKFSVTYEAADPIKDEATPLPDLTNREFIMYVGRPLPHKNLWRLIEAFQIVQQTHPSLHLILVGKKDALYENIAAKVRAKHIKNVVFTGFVSDGELRWLYEHCEAYVFPSLSEGFGLPALEAMQHGAPVVSSKATCLPEIYGKAAHYFSPKDTSDIAKKINEVLADASLRKKLIIRGKERAIQYSWKHMATQTLHVYRKALGE